jgi:hypothetical protein
MSFGYDGRELAFLWDVEGPEPERWLVHLSAEDGRLISIRNQLPAAEPGYVSRRDLPQRQLLWLPNSMGWIFNLQDLVDTESRLVIDLELPQMKAKDGDEGADARTILDAMPASDDRLLLIIAEPSAEWPATQQVQGRFIELPEISPFL